jgi:hypothetical protein
VIGWRSGPVRAVLETIIALLLLVSTPMATNKLGVNDVLKNHRHRRGAGHPLVESVSAGEKGTRIIPGNTTPR